MQGLYSVGVAAVALGIARAMLDEFIALAKDKTPRGLIRMADMPVVQSDVAHREAALGSGRRVPHGNPERGVGVRRRYRADRHRGTHPGSPRLREAINSAIETADYVYKAAGVSAIFKGTPFERRFRDIHTLSQQIQSRDAHF